MMGNFWHHIHAIIHPLVEENKKILQQVKQEKKISKEKKETPPLHHIFFYAHNLGKFDGVFILKSFLQCNGRVLFSSRETVTMKSNVLIKMKIGKYVHFLDSLQLMNQSLDKLSMIMLDVPKMDIGHKYFTRELLQRWFKNPSLLGNFESYLARDVVLLINIIRILDNLFQKNYNIILGANSTISSIATKVYFSNYYEGPSDDSNKDTAIKESMEAFVESKDENKVLPSKVKESNKTSFWSLTSEQDKFVRDSFTGGRCEVLIPNISPVYSYDINSAFCAAMAYENMPTGKPMGPFKVSDPLGFYSYHLDHFFGFINCTVYSPADMSVVPALFFKTDKGRIIYPLGTFSGTFFSEELKKAKEVGYIIIAHYYIKFNYSKNQFKNFIEDTYSRRIQYKKNTPENLFYKILMLSVYGRFALNPRSETMLIEDNVDAMFRKYKYYPITEVTTFKNIKGETVFMGNVGPTPSISETYGSPFVTSLKASRLRIAPQVASAISSYVRIKVYDVLNGPLRGKIAYTDTDSIFATEPLPENFISDLELGKWKFEGLFDTGVFISKKLYNIFDKTSKTKKLTKTTNINKIKNEEAYKLEANRDSIILSKISEEAYEQEESLGDVKNPTKSLEKILITNKITSLEDLDSIKLAAKGVPQGYLNQISENDWLKMLEKAEYSKLLVGDQAQNAIKMQRDFVTGLITVMSPNISISNNTVDNTRLRIFDTNDKWINTLPLVIENGKRISLIEYQKTFTEQVNVIKNYQNNNTSTNYFNLLKKEMSVIKTQTKQKKSLLNVVKLFNGKYFDKRTATFKQLPKNKLFKMYQMDGYKLEILIILRYLESLEMLKQRQLIKVKNQLEVLVRDDLRRFEGNDEAYVESLLKKSDNE